MGTKINQMIDYLLIESEGVLMEKRFSNSSETPVIYTYDKNGIYAGKIKIKYHKKHVDIIHEKSYNDSAAW